jgi:DNA-binding transcriptional MerR regulator
MLIGELSRRLGVSVRTVRHYDAIGLLTPARVEDGTGYRHYGTAELVRGLRVEQLKAAGLSLADVAAVLDGRADGEATLRRRRATFERDIARRRRQAAVIDALLADGVAVSAPAIVTVPATAVVSATVWAAATELTPCIRRQVQRMRRRLGPDAGWTFAATFPLDPAGTVAVEVAATRPALPAPTATWPGGRVLRIEVVGPPALLPLAHAAAREAATEGGWPLTGTVRETYLALGPSLRTTVDVPISAAGRAA